MAKRPKSKTSSILHPTRFVSRRADGTVRIVRDSYHNTKQSWWDMCKRILERDGYRCRAVHVGPDGQKVRCPHSRTTGHRLEVHHVKPLSRGGKTIPSNLICLCDDCHSKRHVHMRRGTH